MTKKPLLLCGIFFASISAILSFVPYLAVYLVMQEILSAWPNIAAIDASRTVSYGWMAFGGVVANVVTYFVSLICTHIAAFGTLYELRVKFAQHLARVPLGFHVMAGSGKLRKIMTENIESIEGFIAHQLPDIVAAIVSPAVMFIILFAVDWRFGLASLVGVFAAVGIYFVGLKKTSGMRVMTDYQAALAKMSNAMVEFIRGIAVVKAFRQTADSFSQLRETIKEYTELAVPYTLSLQTSYCLFNTLINHTYLFIIFAGILVGLSTDDFHSFVPTFIFYLVFVPAISGILLKMIYAVGGSARVMTGIREMDGVLNVATLPQKSSTTIPSTYDVRFENVCFSYDGSDAKALKNVSFVARQNEITAIVGSSGSGKSTIAHLIPRFFDVNEGAVSIGGVDVRNMTTDTLMEQVSFVFQDVFLFKQSVRENIRMGNPKATDEQVASAAKAAQCHDLAMALSNGYDTVIGTEGIHLSGGERQRISIARAIIKDALILVLDEATAFADPENEHLIQKALQELMRDKTVIVIAHRLPTVRDADKIIVMDDGHVCETGVHDGLMMRNSRYSVLWHAYDKSVGWRMERAV
jgi:ATP-binding cassette subfamily B protein